MSARRDGERARGGSRRRPGTAFASRRRRSSSPIRSTAWHGGSSRRARRRRTSSRRPTRAPSAAGDRSRPGTNLRAWLLRILTNLNIDRGRRKQRAPDEQPLEEGDYFLYNRLEQASRDGNVDEERVVERLSQDDIVGALSAVPHDFRDVVVLVDIGDFTYQDAAQILDIPIGTVMSRLHRGRRILKRELADRATGGA